MIVKRKYRTSTGSLASLAFVAAVPLMVAIGAFAVDTMHYNSVQAEVQRACDAGALAGAQDLWEYNMHPNNPPQVAITTAGMNDADGSGIPASEVTAKVETVPTPTQLGTVRCTIAHPYINLLAKIFGNKGSTMTCSALAGAGTAIGTNFNATNINTAAANGLFPLAVSWQIPSSHDGKALMNKNLGDTVYLEWHNNVEWTAFTAHDASDVRSYIDSYMKPGATTETGSPPVPIGSSINCSNGIQDTNIQATSSNFGPSASSSGSTGSGSSGSGSGSCGSGSSGSSSSGHGSGCGSGSGSGSGCGSGSGSGSGSSGSASSSGSISAGDTLYLPVVNAPSSMGMSNYPVIGFIGIQVTSVTVNGANSYIQGTIADGLMLGYHDPSLPASATSSTTGVLSSSQLPPPRLLN